MPIRFFKSPRWLPVATAAWLLAACTTVSDVVPTSNPNVFTVSTLARGVSTSWAGAHVSAMTEATDYCAQRGMRVSVKQESVSGGGVEGRSELAFEFHPVYDSAAEPRG